MSDIPSLPAFFIGPGGKPFLVLDVYGIEEGMDGYEIAAVDLTKTLARDLLKKLAGVKRLHKTNPDLYDASFLDTSCAYYFGEDTGIGRRAPQWDASCRTEMDRVVATVDDYVYWETLPKYEYYDCLLETGTLEGAQLRQFLKGKNPWPVCGDEFTKAIVKSFCSNKAGYGENATEAVP